MNRLIFISIFCIFIPAIQAQTGGNVIPGAERSQLYLPLLLEKRVTVLTNQTGRVKNENIVDFLQSKKIRITSILSPEHGFRGTADAGEKVNNSIDEKTGIHIISLYGSTAGKSLDSVLQTVDVLVFDLQDVGLRYYTYLTTMIKAMKSCALHNVKMIVLDRPNPNGFYIDGPILDMKYKSDVGYVPVPIVHGMTLGELARMAIGENWLPANAKCDLTVIPCLNYTHRTHYQLPVPPSPNLPNMRSVYLYPSLCYFEATPVSVGRGTSAPFQQFGNPQMKGYSYSFTPKSTTGAKTPPQMNQICYGVNLQYKPTNKDLFDKGIDLSYLISAYKNLNTGDAFFTPFFEKLTGVDYIRTMIKEGKNASEIKSMWKNDVEKFKKLRRPYLLYAE